MDDEKKKKKVKQRSKIKLPSKLREREKYLPGFNLNK